MAGYDRHGRGGVAHRLTKEVQKKLGILALPREQCPLDYLGLVRPCVCSHSSATRSGGFEYSWRTEERLKTRNSHLFTKHARARSRRIKRLPRNGNNSTRHGRNLSRPEKKFAGRVRNLIQIL